MTTYDEAFAALMAKVEQDPDAQKAFAEDPVAALRQEGIPLVPTLEVPAESLGFTAPALTPEQIKRLVEPMGVGAPAVARAAGVTVGKRWWGINIRMDQQTTQDFIDGITPAQALGPIIAGALAYAGVLSGGLIAVVGGGMTLILAAKIAQIKLTNRGKGVHWPITWLQWTGLLSAMPLGPIGLAGAAIALLHPVRN